MQPSWRLTTVSEVWTKEMPSLFRFLFVVGVILGTAFAGLYVMATQFEPEQRETSYPLLNVQVERQ